MKAWADRFRALHREIAPNSPGRWRTSRTPYLAEIMEWFTDLEAAPIAVFLKCARIGGTSVIENALGRFIHLDPCPMLVMQPTIEDAKAFSRKHIDGMIQATGQLAEKFPRRGARNDKARLLEKDFPGGSIKLIGSNAGSGLRRETIRIVLIDEASGCSGAVKNEGDPIRLAAKRTETIWNRRIFLTSTPTIEGRCRTTTEYERSDMRLYHVPCPHCGELQPLVFENFKFWRDDEGAITDAQFGCVGCKALIAESHKPDMLAAGKWIPTHPNRRMHGWKINVFYSPFYSWKSVAEDFLTLKEAPEGLQVWANTYLAETYKLDAEQLDPVALSARRERYPHPIPYGVCVLTAGVDVQSAGRLEALIVGWGVGEEAWIVAHKIFEGDVRQSPSVEDSVWARLDAWLSEPREHESGVSLNVIGSGVDTGGHAAKQVYDFCYGKTTRGVVPVKGASTYPHPLIVRGKRNASSGRRKVGHYMIGTETAKNTLFARLNIAPPEGGRAPGYIHLPDTVDEEFCKQLTNEKVISFYRKGKLIWRYDKIGPNEALDMLVYAYAMLGWRQVNFAAVAASFPSRAEADAPPQSPKEGKKIRKTRTGKGFVNAWKR